MPDPNFDNLSEPPPLSFIGLSSHLALSNLRTCYSILKKNLRINHSISVRADEATPATEIKAMTLLHRFSGYT
jgi:hypothetical protein